VQAAPRDVFWATQVRISVTQRGSVLELSLQLP
jgi:hypothetical protein